MSIRKIRAYLALALFALVLGAAWTAGKLARTAEMAGTTYDLTPFSVLVIGASMLASALVAWNVGEYVANDYRTPLSAVDYYNYAERAGDNEAYRRHYIKE